jgi:hypothetical protein
MAEDIALQRTEATSAERDSGEMRERMHQRAARQREMQQEKARRAKEFLERQERERIERERAALERREAQPPPVIPIHFATFTVPASPWQSEPPRSGAATFRLLQRCIAALDIQSNRRPPLPAALPNRTP